MPTSEGETGRGHRPFGFTTWLAGGGVKGGMVHGTSDEFGWHPNDGATAEWQPKETRTVTATWISLTSMRWPNHFDPTGNGDPLNGPFWNEGNFDGDGDTDITDFNFLASNFAPSGYATSTIPEPSTMLLTSLALILVGVSFRLSKNG